MHISIIRASDHYILVDFRYVKRRHRTEYSICKIITYRCPAIAKVTGIIHSLCTINNSTFLIRNSDKRCIPISSFCSSFIWSDTCRRKENIIHSIDCTELTLSVEDRSIHLVKLNYKSISASDSFVSIYS